jgi:hypothetical protein
MPDAAGKLQLQDYISELQVRGFDQFSTPDLTSFINRGYFHVARKHRWYWEETTDAFTVAPGAVTVNLWPAVGGELPQFRALDRLYITTAGKQSRLTPMNQDEFFENWLSQDLTQTKFRGEPDKYYIWAGKLYILPPPSASRDFLAHYKQRVVPMVATTDQPITPQHLDEAIVMAALRRCHERSSEPALAAMVEADLQEFFDDMSDDEEFLMAEQQDRMVADDTWL